jgi:hypothetical protein
MGMRAGRLWSLALAFSILAAAWAAPPALADDTATLYDPARMFVVKLSLPEKSRKELAIDRNKYQPGTFSLAESSNGRPSGVGSFSSPVSVEMKLKGSASYRPLSGKSAFKIRFPQGEPFRGLRYMTLNNMVEDPSMIHETLAYTAFRGSGVPASRTGYAYVYVDGEDYGVHLNIETLDRVALEKHFGPFDEDVQHLYEGENGADVHPGLQWNFEVDEGDEGERDDLEDLIDAVNSSGSASWADRVAAVADLQEMTRMWAVEKYIGQWDGYAGVEDSALPNNYYLYSDPNGRFQIFPWGNDESWQAPGHLPFDGHAGLMFDRCVDDDACFAIYRQAVSAVHKAVAGMGLDALALNSAALLAPWQVMEDEDSSREEWDLDEIAAKVDETRAFIASRPAEAAEWLGESDQLGGSETGPAGSVPQSPEPRKSTGESLRIGKVRLTGRVLHTQMQVRTAGLVTMRATISTGKGSLVVCRDQARVKRARGVVLRCRLPISLRERLRRKSLGITIATRFFPASGSLENASRWIVLPRS